MTELERSGQRSSGFYDEDARNLQQIYDAEYEDYAKKEREIRKQNKLRGQKLLLLQKKRILHERQKHEEADEVAADDQFQLWLELIHQDTTESTCLIEVNSVTARVLSISGIIEHYSAELSRESERLLDCVWVDAEAQYGMKNWSLIPTI